ncbi:hypothetical protein J0X12_03250 [Sneathiella sp. CAU 1612]|uniref:Replication protein n=1 Tax=Sneathiella sedimenti TaxID=2816034 RepID=A0ABS3F273_9PROT|nr:hypothetical protein [Sneathiella sedimenti]MBO0332614.1 hypothetical protein [Sneathiella sedimenti]
MSFYLMHRGWMENPAFRRQPYSDREAWCWLVENAVWKTGVKLALPKTDIELKRGQLSYSTRYLAEAWKWPEAKVRRRLALFEKRSMIERKSDAGQTVITICNYSAYQGGGRIADAESDAEMTQDRRRSDANNNKETRKQDHRYHFEGEIIRLNEIDFHRWQKAYPAIPDLRAELTSLDDYFRAETPKNWFAAVSGALRKRNIQYLGGKKTPAHKMTDAEYNALHSDLVTSNPLGRSQ